MPSAADQSFSLAEARRIVADLLRPSPWYFWCDFLLTMTVAYTAAGVYLMAPAFTPWQLICYPIAGFALFRASLFMHEIVHFRSGEMTAFKVAWNLLAGVVMLVPSFLYESHLAHHNAKHYGTGNDGEYLPLGVGSLGHLCGFLLQILVLPIFVVFRFLVVTPISFLHPRIRQFVLERMSSFVINFGYRRAIPETAPRTWWAVIEWLCFARAAAIFVCIGIGFNTWERLPMLYSLALLSLGLNHVRTLVAHRYLSTGERMTHAEQLDDSVNISGGWLTELLFPVGLRYHALHHLFPSIPYHNLGRAHRRLLAELPADSAYHRATQPTFRAALKNLLHSSREAMLHPPPPSRLWYARRREMLEAVAPVLEEERPPRDAGARQQAFSVSRST